MSEWQPIETAPHYRLVDVWTRAGERVADAQWLKGAWRQWSIDSFGCMDWVRLDSEPTHWMLPPEPPAQRGEGG